MAFSRNSTVSWWNCVSYWTYTYIEVAILYLCSITLWRVSPFLPHPSFQLHDSGHKYLQLARERHSDLMHAGGVWKLSFPVIHITPSCVFFSAALGVQKHLSMAWVHRQFQTRGGASSASCKRYGKICRRDSALDREYIIGKTPTVDDDNLFRIRAKSTGVKDLKDICPCSKQQGLLLPVNGRWGDARWPFRNLIILKGIAMRHWQLNISDW